MAVFAAVVADMPFISVVFLDNFVRVGCIDHNCHSCAVAYNHFWHSFAQVDYRHPYKSRIAVVEY